MTEDEYTLGRGRAMPILRGKGYSLEMAEDAIQAAAVYFLTRSYKRVTAALFTYRALQRAVSARESAYGSGRRPNIGAVFVGTSNDLATFNRGSAVYTTDADEND